MKPGILPVVSLLAVGMLFASSMNVSAQQTDSPSYLRPQHQTVIEKWLSVSPRRANLRIATDKDCRNKTGLAFQRKDVKDYQPYYAFGDFNHDGREDFAIAVVNDRRQRSKFSFAIFNGPFNATAVPAYMEENIGLGRWTFFWRNGSRDSNLLQGEFESDNCVIYKPRGKTYIPKPCLE